MASPYLTAGSGSSTTSPYASAGSSSGSSAPPPAAKKSGGGILGKIEKYSGAQFVGNLGRDVGKTAVGVGPGLYHAGSAITSDVKRTAAHPLRSSSIYAYATGGKQPQSTVVQKILKP